MSDEKTFVDGMIVKRHDNAPDFVICNLSLKGKELVEFMRQHQNDGWVNVQIKRSQGGKLYAELDTWKPEQQATQQQAPSQQGAAPPKEDFSDFDDSIPF